jgi:hypothetical protein
LYGLRERHCGEERYSDGGEDEHRELHDPHWTIDLMDGG